MADTAFDFSARRNDGTEISMSDFKGKTLLIVNTASNCGFTPQYEGLEALYRAHKDEGLVVLGFPCDQFAHQEPGTDAEIAAFCKRNFGVSFPLMAKVEVNGGGTHPLFAFLKKAAPGAIGESVKWNFTKFLVAKDGSSVRRFDPATEPAALENDILQALGKSS